MRCSLKHKMALSVCALLLVIFSAASIITLRFFSLELKNIIAQQQFQLIAAIAEDLDQQLMAGQEIIFRTAAAVTSEIVADPEKIQHFLDQPLNAGTRLFFDNGIFFFSPTGTLLAETPFRSKRRGKNYAFRDYFKQTIETSSPQISTPYVSSQEHHHPAINFTAPIFDSFGQISAIIAGSVDLSKDNFLGRLGNVIIGESGYLYLYNTDRLMIMHPDPKRIMQKDVPVGANRLFDRAIEGFEGTEETINSRGLSMLTSFKHLATTDWILAANYPAKEAFAPIARAHRYMAIGLLALLLTSTLIVWLVMGKFIRPLLSFTNHVQMLSPDDSQRTKLPITTRDEIGILGQAFNRLMAEVGEEKALSASRLQFLQTLSDSIPNPLYYKDLDGRYMGCNLAYEKIRGVHRAELLGKTTNEVFDSDEAKEQELDEFELMHDSDFPAEIVETSVTYGDGSRHDVLFYKAIFRDEREAPAGMVGTMVDITRRKSIEIALVEQKKFSEDILQSSAVPSFVVDINHRVIIWNRACEELTGIPATELLGTDQQWRAFYPEQRLCIVDLVLNNDLENVLNLYQTFSNSQLIADGLQAEGWYPDIGGKRRYLSFEAAPIHDSQGKVIAAIETLQDLSSLKHAEEALRQSEESYRSLIERSPDAIIVHRGEKVVFVNQAAATLYGAIEPGQLTGAKVMELTHPDYREHVHDRISEVEIKQTVKPYIEEKILRLDGTTLDVESCSTPVFYREEWSVQTILRDIHDRKELQEQVWRQANFDGLTQIPNRLLFNDRLQKAIEWGEREGHAVALMFIDLDYFKEINDTLGHESGDALLRQVASRLGKGLRKSATLARMGGDEFTVVIPCVLEVPNVSIVARRLLEDLAQPFALPGGDARISGSIGIAIFPDDARDIPLLLHHADSAMYRAKKSGRNTFCFHSCAEVNQTPEKNV